MLFRSNGAPTKKVHRPNHLSFHDAGAHRQCAVDQEGAPRTFCRRRSERRWPRFPPFVLQAQSQFTRPTEAPRVRQAAPYKAAKSMPPIAVSHSHQLVEKCSGLGFSTQFLDTGFRASDVPNPPVRGGVDNGSFSGRVWRPTFSSSGAVRGDVPSMTVPLWRLTGPSRAGDGRTECGHGEVG